MSRIYRGNWEKAQAATISGVTYLEVYYSHFEETGGSPDIYCRETKEVS